MVKSRCKFCKIVKGKLPAAIVWQDDEYACFMDKYPINPGHVLVVPKKHYAFLTDMPVSSAGKLFEHATRITNGICKTLKPDGINIGQSNGRVASQSIFHVHIHIVPRFKGDAKKGFWPERKKLTYKQLNDLAENIADVMEPI